jgi:tRNA threonylcarbamoyladenosine biosynthesis protein TsaE
MTAGIEEIRGTHTTQSESETEAIASKLGAALSGGEVVLLYGDLGAGKTAFVRGLARGLGIDAEEVASPTFVLMTRYSGRLSLHHADLYRLRPGDETELGFEELPGRTGVLAIEWAERLAYEPWALVIRVRLAHAGDDARTVDIATGAA